MNQDREQKYAAALRELAASVGSRNRRLPGVATLGLLAGKSPVEIEQDLLDAGAAGRSPLTVAEVRRAVERAVADGYGNEAVPLRRPMRVRPTPKTPAPPSTLPPEWFIEEMTRRGRERFAAWIRDTGTPEAEADPFAALQAVSPHPLDGDTLPGTTAALQVAALFENEVEHLYAGPLTGAGNSDFVHKAGAFVREVAHGGRFIAPANLPDRILPNPVTGEEGRTKDGKPSYRCEATVTALRNAVVEFDGLDADGDGCRRQALFWLGVVTSRTKRGQMPLPVRCLVFSGSKSIHAALCVSAADRPAWDAAWLQLSRDLHGLDGAFRSPAQCMRLAGAVRTDGKGAGNVQTLLWCAAPSPAWRGILADALAAQLRR